LRAAPATGQWRGGHGGGGGGGDGGGTDGVPSVWFASGP